MRSPDLDPEKPACPGGFNPARPRPPIGAGFSSEYAHVLNNLLTRQANYESGNLRRRRSSPGSPARVFTLSICPAGRAVDGAECRDFSLARPGAVCYEAASVGTRSANFGFQAPAGVAELADAPDLGSGAARRGGSSPSTRTTGTVAADVAATKVPPSSGIARVKACLSHDCHLAEPSATFRLKSSAVGAVCRYRRRAAQPS